jgi:hypothetical protein
MSRDMFLTIMQGTRGYGPYLRCKPDTASKLGFTSYQKCSVNGAPGDLIDEYLQIRNTTCLESMYKFCKFMIAVFGGVYLR